MQENRPVLSISLLASDRRETIRKCLDSLKPIMEQLPCELIIVDTGCSEEVQAVLREYTSQIIPFVWCRDFSKARNAGLTQAKGEWFMYIDDDEWFTDVTEIVDFFKSGEYRQYGYAFYIQRNYFDYEEKRYQDSWVSRIVRLDKDIRFVSSIHEYFYPIKGEMKLLYSPVKHFGYIFDSEEERYRHSQRNVSLLLDMIQKERGKSRWWIQLAQEYMSIFEYQKLYDVCEEALRQFAGRNDPNVNRERGAFYMGKLLADMKRYMYKEAVRDYEKAVCDRRNTRICQAALYTQGAGAYIIDGQYEKAEELCDKYLEIYNESHDDEYTLISQGTFFVRDAFDNSFRNNIYCYLIICGFKRGDTGPLKVYFDSLGWQDKDLYIYTGLVPEIIDYFSSAEYEAFFDHVADVLVGRKGVQEVVVSEIQKRENEDADKFRRLMEIFAKVESPHYYISYLRILYAEVSGNIGSLEEDFGALFGCVVDIFQLSDKVFQIAQDFQVNLEPLFIGIPFDRWKQGVDAFMENAELEMIESRLALVEIWHKRDNVRYDYFLMKAAEAMLVYGKYQDDYVGLHNLLKEFADRTFYFYSKFFKKNAFHGEMELLPPAARVAVRLGAALESEPSGDVIHTLKCYKECLGLFPPLNDAVKGYCHLYGSQVKRQQESFT